LRMIQKYLLKKYIHTTFKPTIKNEDGIIPMAGLTQKTLKSLGGKSQGLNGTRVIDYSEANYKQGNGYIRKRKKYP